MSLRWEVEYYEGSLPLVSITSEEVAWEHLPPSGVVRVRITDGEHTMILSGMDRYWLKENLFGQFIVDVEQYEGEQGSAYIWDDEGCRKLEDYAFPEDAALLEGVWVPEPDASKIGIS